MQSKSVAKWPSQECIGKKGRDTIEHACESDITWKYTYELTSISECVHRDIFHSLPNLCKLLSCWIRSSLWIGLLALHPSTCTARTLWCIVPHATCVFDTLLPLYLSNGCGPLTLLRKFFTASFHGSIGTHSEFTQIKRLEQRWLSYDKVDAKIVSSTMR